jgi:hypothetical protein
MNRVVPAQDNFRREALDSRQGAWNQRHVQNLPNARRSVPRRFEARSPNALQAARLDRPARVVRARHP